MAKTAEELQRLDAAILLAMQHRPAGIMTYVIRNILAWDHGFAAIETPAILSRLKFMERSGRVKRVGSPYAVQLCWALAEGAAPC